MPLSWPLRAALYLLLLDGAVALYLGDFLGPRGLALVIVLLGGSGLAQARGLRLEPGGPVARLVVLLAAAGSVLDVFYLSDNVLDGLVRLLLFLVLYKLLTLRTVRETRAIAFLGFFMLVAASASAFDVGFLGVFVAFVVLATWLAVGQQVQLETESRPGRAVVGAGAGAVSGREVLTLGLAAAAGVLLLTAGLFFVLPRIGLAALPLRGGAGQMVTGFSDRVELGAYGSILTNETVVMRVHLPDATADPDRLPGLRWRGIVLDEFDGRAWSVRHPRRIRLLRPSAGGFDVGFLQGGGRVLRQEIYLDPIGSEVVFAAPHALHLGLPLPVVTVDDMGSVIVPPPTSRVAYTAESELEDAPGTRPPAVRVARPLGPATRARYLQLPALPARIPALARQVAAGTDDPYEAARRLTAFLLREFRYTLNLQRVSALDPLEEFLFVRRAGHCEYFAASLAVMLRTLGIPARVVNGFQRGEWNPHGRYFMVRLRDAHSWVEAWVGDGAGGGWVTFDPTPRAAADPGPGTATSAAFLYLDALRLGWNRYVINWNLRDQVEAARTLRAWGAGWRPHLPGLAPPGDPRRLGAAAVLVAALVLAGIRGWRAASRPRLRGAARLPEFYRQALRALARRGLRPAGGETAREFQARVAHLGPRPGRAFARLTAGYERARFGGVPPTAPERADLAACVAELAAPAEPAPPPASSSSPAPSPPA